MLNLIVLDDAEEELAEAEKYYESRVTGLGAELVTAIGQVIDRILEHPQAAPPHAIVGEHTGARSARVTRFPYSVVYLENDGAIWVIAFAHDRRRPGYWRDRTPS